MFRGYAQQVRPQQKHTIIPELMGLFRVGISDRREHRAGTEETWVLCLWLAATKPMHFPLPAGNTMVTSFIKGFEIY